MALPKILKAFNLFGNGHDWRGLIPEVTLPELKRKFEEYRPGDMDGPVGIDVGQEKIELKWKPGGLLADILPDYAATTHDAVQLRFVGSYESDDSGGTVAVEILVRGRHEQIGMGEAKGGDKGGWEVTTQCSYYRLIVGGVDEIEIDLPGNILKVHGVDRLAERRRALGLL